MLKLIQTTVMFLKCSLLRGATARMLRTSGIQSAYCHTNKDHPTESQDAKGKSRFRDFMEKWKQQQITEDIPKKETIRSILKVQKVKKLPEGFKVVYQFPKIKYFGLVNRLKAHYTIFSVLITGVTALLGSGGVIPWDYVYDTTTLGICGCLMFYSLGFAANRFVGFMYYNQTTDMVRIAYVDFWGRRRDLDVPLGDVIPKDECPRKLTSALWHSLERYSSKETFKLQLQQGVIVDEYAMKKILL